MKTRQTEKNILSDKKYVLIIAALALIMGGGIFSYLANQSCDKKGDAPAHFDSSIPAEEARTENNKITYKTFSSPKADFTFEYPDTWVYEEKQNAYDTNETDWIFYSGPKKNQDNLIFATGTSNNEWVDFCSIGYRSEERSYKISIFPTNDSKTFITYEQCGEEEYGSIYIYWQKGEYFRNANDIKDILKIDFMVYFSGIENNSGEIAQHIAQSIKIK